MRYHRCINSELKKRTVLKRSQDLSDDALITRGVAIEEGRAAWPCWIRIHRYNWVGTPSLDLLPFDEANKLFLKFSLSASFLEVIDAPQVVNNIPRLSKVHLEEYFSPKTWDGAWSGRPLAKVHAS